MNSPADIPSPTDPPDVSGRWPSHPELVGHENRNLLVLAAQQILFRVGWIFKTESIIMPAFLDTVSGAGWLRGCLPVLSRLGQSVPPVFWAERLRATAHKKWPLAIYVVLMGAVFGVLMLSLCMHVVHLLHPAFEMRYGLLSVGLALLFLAWVLPDAVGLLGPRRGGRPAWAGGPPPPLGPRLADPSG